MTAPEPMDPAAIMAAHAGPHVCGGELIIAPDLHACLVHRLAEALTAERARVQRVEALTNDWTCENYVHPHICRTNPDRRASSPYIADGYCWPCKVGAALAGGTEGEQPQREQRSIKQMMDEANHGQAAWAREQRRRVGADGIAGDPR